KRSAFGYVTQRLTACSHVGSICCAAEFIKGGLQLLRRRSNAGVLEELVYKGSRGRACRKGRGKRRPLHECRCEVLLIGLELSVPSSLSDHYSLSDCFCVRQKLI